MAIALFPLAVAIIGLLMWVLSSNSKVAEAGKIMFLCGVMALCFSLASTTVSIGSGPAK